MRTGLCRILPMSVATVFNVVLGLIVLTLPLMSAGLNSTQLKRIAGAHGVRCVLVFGDSTVDPGNNNRLETALKSDFPPYGKNFVSGLPTGRFCNGRLTTDFIADALGCKSSIPAFLDPTLTQAELLSGVSFASAGSGYDELTAHLTNVLALPDQLDYFQQYKNRLRLTVGSQEAAEVISKALFLLSIGTNDFLMNYYINPLRQAQFSVEQYQDFLVLKMVHTVNALYGSGARRLLLIGIPPMGCLPIVRTLHHVSQGCFDEYNEVAASFNRKIKKALLSLGLEMKTSFIDIYDTLRCAVENPKLYGFAEASRGCCGTGSAEFGETCRGLTTCADPAKYVFWDAIHPTEKLYRIAADNILSQISHSFLNSINRKFV